MLTPKWAHAPTSGIGAALHGGRANRRGIDAVYVSTEAQTAIAEYQQLSPLMPPGTLVSFEISVGPIVDFTAGYSFDGWDPLWNDFNSDWRSLWFDKKIEPPSWVLGDMVIAAAAKGILFRSNVRSEGINMVLYPGTLTTDDMFQVYDPAHALPRNADSWK
jgi:RES domain-containing protein